MKQYDKTHKILLLDQFILHISDLLLDDLIKQRTIRFFHFPIWHLQEDVKELYSG